MNVHHGLETLSGCQGGWIAIGNFDGVHRGHQAMLTALRERARAANVPAIVMTFNPHPIALLRPQQIPPTLSLLADKLELFAQAGVDDVVIYPTDFALLKLTPDEFFQSIVMDKLNARGLVEGPNFCFGRDRSGNVETLQSLCRVHQRELVVVPAVQSDGRLVSSSQIRTLIAAGQLAEAVAMLGHPYRIHGVVRGGAARGRTIGFPTANLEEIATLCPPDGVYAGRCSHENRVYPAAVNLGANPTFGETGRKFEVHLLGFHGDLYGQSLTVDLLARVRDVVRFESRDALIQQLQSDLEVVRGLANIAAGK